MVGKRVLFVAKFDIDFPDELVRQLEKLENFDEVAEAMLTEAEPILREEITSEASTHKDTGEMVGSIKSQIKKNKIGWFLTTYPQGKDSQGVRNMDKMMYIEYGTKDTPADPILSRAVRKAEPKVLAKMQEVFDRYFK